MSHDSGTASSFSSHNPHYAKALLETLFDIANTSKPTSDAILSILEKIKHQALSAAAEEEEFIRKAAGDFTLDEAVQTFGLTYRSNLRESPKRQ